MTLGTEFLPTPPVLAALCGLVPRFFPAHGRFGHMSAVGWLHQGMVPDFTSPEQVKIVVARAIASNLYKTEERLAVGIGRGSKDASGADTAFAG